MDSVENMASGQSFQQLQGVQNWTAWCFKIRVLLRAMGLLDVVEGTFKADEDQEKWMQKDSKAQGMLVTNISEKVIPQILSCKTSKEIWDKLHTIFEQRGELSVHILQQKFFSMKFEERETVSEFLGRFESLLSKLKNLNAEVSQTMAITKITSSLPSQFQHFVSAWESVPAEKRTMDQLTARLLIEEQRASAKNKEDESSAFVHKSNRKCYRCGKVGHLKKECKSKSRGMQHSVIRGEEPRGLPLSEKILPQYLKDLGYKTHLVGKWHLGHYKKEYLPLNRGFDSHLGFWSGKIDLYDHTNVELATWGFDMRRGFDVADDLFGQYATDIFTKEAVKVVNAHNKSEPLFLMVAHAAMHSGNPSEFLRAPDEYIDRFSHINDTQRRKFAGMLAKLDESVGKVVESLGKKGLLENTIILFSSDNGGPAAGFNNNAASNYPLRGVKNTLWEGGVRGAGLLWSPLIKQQSRVANQTFHLVDWLPTFYSAAGGNTSVFTDKNIDGFDLWEALSKDLPSQRTKIVHNIDDIWGVASITVDNWKIHKGTTYNGSKDYWFGPGGREGTYDYDLVYKSNSAEAIDKITKIPSKDKIKNIRDASSIKCDKSIPLTPCKPLVKPCLFDINADPCERRNMAEEKPEILQALLTELERVNATAVLPNNKDMDPAADPKYWGRVFTNFGDFERLRSPPVKCT